MKWSVSETKNTCIYNTTPVSVDTCRYCSEMDLFSKIKISEDFDTITFLL